jgi:hypothetical protein
MAAGRRLEGLNLPAWPNPFTAGLRTAPRIVNTATDVWTFVRGHR